MVLDLAYAVRSLLNEQGLDNSQLLGFLTHSTRRRSDARDLAVTNSLACLRELDTFNRPDQAYPGDRASGLPPVDCTQNAFDHAYFLHLGDNLEDQPFEAATASVADYVYLNVATRCGQLLDECRKPDPTSRDETSSDATVRTFGISQGPRVENSIATQWANIACCQVIRRWLGDVSPDQADPSRSIAPAAVLAQFEKHRAAPNQFEFERRAKDLIVELGLEYGPIVEGLRRAAEEQLGGKPENYFIDLLQQIDASDRPSSPAASATSVVNGIVKTVNAVMGHRDNDATHESNSTPVPIPSVSLRELLEDHVQLRGDELGSALAEWIRAMVDKPGTRLAGPIGATQWFSEHLNQTEAQSRGHLHQVEKELTQVAQSLNDETVGHKTPEGDARGDLPSSNGSSRQRLFTFTSEGIARNKASQKILDHCLASMHAILLRSVCKMLLIVRDQIDSQDKQLRNMRGEIDCLTAAFEGLGANQPRNSNQSGQRDLSERNDAIESVGDAQAADPAKEIPFHINELAAQLDAEFQSSFLDEQGGLFQILTSGIASRAKLPGALRKLSKTMLRPIIRDVETRCSQQNLSGDARHELEEVSAQLALALPAWHKPGRAKRLVAVLPEGSDAAALSTLIEQGSHVRPNVVFDSEPHATFCWEAEQVPLINIAAELTNDRPDYAEIAARLHTRVDIQWSNLLPAEPSKQ